MRWALVQRIDRYGVEIVTAEGVHFCVPADVWNRWLDEAWREVWPRLQGQP